MHSSPLARSTSTVGTEALNRKAKEPKIRGLSCVFCSLFFGRLLRHGTFVRVEPQSVQSGPPRVLGQAPRE